MKEEEKAEIQSMRERLIGLRNQALMRLDAAASVGLSHAIRALSFVLDGRDFEEAP